MKKYTDIIQEFDKQFDHKNQSKGFCDSDCTNDYSIGDIKSFLVSTLQAHDEEIIKMIEEIPDKNPAMESDMYDAGLASMKHEILTKLK